MKPDNQPSNDPAAMASPLLKKARSLGLWTPDSLRALAVKRGCHYYDVGPWDDGLREEMGMPPSLESFTNTELAVALLSLYPPVDQLRQRMGAAVLSSPEVKAAELAVLAEQEGCAPLVRHIAACGGAVEPDNPFWTELGGLLEGHTFDIHAMPHPTRFIEMTGITRGRVGIQKHWIRPHSPTAA